MTENQQTAYKRSGNGAAANRHRDQYDFLPAHLELVERPPSSFARITAISLSIGVLAVLIWACFGQLDIHATAMGKLIIPSRSQTIQAYELGKVVEIKVRDGQIVQAGDPVLVLNTLGVEQDVKRLELQRQYQQRELARYTALFSDDPVNNLHIPDTVPLILQEQTRRHLQSVVSEYQTLIRNIENEMAVNQVSQQAIEIDIQALEKLVINITHRVEARSKLQQAQMIGKVELLEQEKELLETQRYITQQHSELAVLKTQHQSLQEQLVSFKTQRSREWFDKFSEMEIALASTEQELKKAQERDWLEIVRSPISGTVQQLVIHTVGGVVQPAQPLMVIVPHDAVQVAEVNILNKDVGFITAGQSVILKVDAFPYTRYGTIDAEVTNVSRDSVKDEKLGMVFPAQVLLKENQITVDGDDVTLSPGMSVVAEIKTGKRLIIDYILSPIREYQAEAMREK